MKGIVFTLDVVFSVSIMMIIITAIIIYSTPSSFTSDTSSVLIASDIISLLDEKGVLDTLDPDLISGNLSQVLPQNLNMSITLHIYDEDLDFEETIQINTDLTDNYYKGKWLFIVGNITDVENLVMVEYKVGFV